MSIEFACPECGEQMRVPQAFGGTRGQCRGCRAMLTVPMPSSAGPPSPPPQAPLAVDDDVPFDMHGSDQPRGADRWCVVLMDAGTLRSPEHAPILAEPLGLSERDAVQVLAACSGLLYVPRWGSVDDTVNALGSLGIQGHAVRRRELWPLPDVVKARHISWDNEGFSAWAESEAHALRTAWSDVVAINLGDVAVERTKKSLDRTTVARLREHGIDLADTKKGKTRHRPDALMADVVTSQPWYRIRLMPAAVDFSVLGPHRTPSSPVNLKVLVGLLLPACHRAKSNLSGLWSDIAGRPATEWPAPTYRSMTAFEAHTQWMLNRMLLTR